MSNRFLFMRIFKMLLVLTFVLQMYIVASEMANCDTFDIRQHPMWPKWLTQKDRLRGLAAVPIYKIAFEKLHAFQKPVLIITGTTTIQPNQIIDKLLSYEYPNAKSSSLPGDHIAVYQNPEIFVQTLNLFLRETDDGY